MSGRVPVQPSTAGRLQPDTPLTVERYRVLRAWQAIPASLRASVVVSAAERARRDTTIPSLDVCALDIRDEAATWRDGDWTCETVGADLMFRVGSPREDLALFAPGDLPFEFLARSVVTGLVTGASVDLELDQGTASETRVFFDALELTLPLGILRVQPLFRLQGALRPLRVVRLDTRSGTRLDPDGSRLLADLRHSYLDPFVLRVPWRCDS